MLLRQTVSTLPTVDLAARRVDSGVHQRRFIFRLVGRGIGESFFVLAAFFAALKLARSVLVHFLDHKASAAFGASLRDWLVSHSELARGVSGAAVEGASLASFNHKFTRSAFWTAYAGGLLLDVFALWIIRTSGERPEATLFQHEILAALRA